MGAGLLCLACCQLMLTAKSLYISPGMSTFVSTQSCSFTKLKVYDTSRGAIGGKTGKTGYTVLLPGFCKIERSSGRGLILLDLNANKIVSIQKKNPAVISTKI